MSLKYKLLSRSVCKRVQKIRLQLKFRLQSYSDVQESYCKLKHVIMNHSVWNLSTSPFKLCGMVVCGTVYSPRIIDSCNNTAHYGSLLSSTQPPCATRCLGIWACKKLNCFIVLSRTWRRTVPGSVRVPAVGASNAMSHSKPAIVVFCSRVFLSVLSAEGTFQLPNWLRVCSLESNRWFAQYVHLCPEPYEYNFSVLWILLSITFHEGKSF